MLQSFFNFYLQIMQRAFSILYKYQLPLLCILGGAGVGIYLYGSRKLFRLRTRQREQMRRHPDEPVPALPEVEKKAALAFEIVGFIFLFAACLAMFVLGHFDRYLALLGFGR